MRVHSRDPMFVMAPYVPWQNLAYEGSVWMGNPRDNTVLGWFLFSGLKIIRNKSYLTLVVYIGEE